MAFNSFQYAALLSLVVGVFWLVKPALRRWLVLGASCVFYASWDVRFVGLLLTSCTVAFLAGRYLARTEDDVRRRYALVATVLFNVWMLGFFKYFDFFFDSTRGLLDRLGTAPPDFALRIALPVGISFFTFQMLSYVVDVYRREVKATDSYLTFLLFGSFFPHLLAGPICRARRLLPQLEFRRRAPDPVQVAEGLELILIGLFMKVAVGDALNQVTGPIFAALADPDAADPSWATLWAATLGSVIQFILDFAGYSNIARGSSKLLGVELPYNFRQPLTRSKDFQDFWRREHMTLMAWFRDYVYRPLHRKGRSPWYNHAVLLLLFALSGLWHGAGWIWITWGLLVGSTLVVELEVKRRRNERHRTRPMGPVTVDQDAASLGEADRVAPEAGATAVRVRERPSTAPAWRSLAPRAYVFVLIAFQVAWVRTASVSSGLDLYGSLLVPRAGAVDVNMLCMFLYGLVAMILVDNRQVRMEKVEGRRDPLTVTRAVGFAAMAVLIVVFSGADTQPFVYFNF